MIKAVFKAIGTCEQCLLECEVTVELEGFHGRFSMPIKATWPESWQPVAGHPRALDTGYVICPDCGHVGHEEVGVGLKDEPEPDERPTAWARMIDG